MVSTNISVLCCHYFTFCFTLDVPRFCHQYDRSLSTSFSSNLLGKWPCTVFPRYLSFVFSAMLSLLAFSSPQFSWKF
jgi:hypothetical protein